MMTVVAVLLCVAIVVILGVWAIKNKVKKFSRDVFGTDNIVDGIHRQADLAAETPKSVSGMTRLMEPDLKKEGFV